MHKTVNNEVKNFAFYDANDECQACLSLMITKMINNKNQKIFQAGVERKLANTRQMAEDYKNDDGNHGFNMVRLG